MEVSLLFPSSPELNSEVPTGRAGRCAVCVWYKCVCVCVCGADVGKSKCSPCGVCVCCGSCVRCGAGGACLYAVESRSGTCAGMREKVLVMLAVCARVQCSVRSANDSGSAWRGGAPDAARALPVKGAQHAWSALYGAVRRQVVREAQKRVRPAKAPAA